MKSIKTNFILINKDLKRVVFAVAMILLAVWVLMQFTDNIAWSLFDFLIAGMFLTGTGLIYFFAIKRISSSRRRTIVGLIIGFILFVIWVELAVGVFGTPFTGS